MRKQPSKASDGEMTMKKSRNSASSRIPSDLDAITELSVAGYKSIKPEQKIEIRPLTILAGANSSGKSSMLQPVLLLKQTLEAPYDPGTLLLYGPNIKFTSVDQLLARIGKGESSDILEIGVKASRNRFLKLTLRKQHRQGFSIDQMQSPALLGDPGVWPGMSERELQELKLIQDMDSADDVAALRQENHKWQLQQRRCFLELALVIQTPDRVIASLTQPLTMGLDTLIAEVIHVPGVRGNPERAYPVAAVGGKYPGTFEKYTASVIAEWSKAKDEASLRGLDSDLVRLGLTGGVWPHSLNDTQIELQVSRLPHLPPRKPEDRVNIADVGFGVSQTLPVLVALRVAKPGQLVYLEQPETHLHPRAQTALADIVASAAERGV